MTKFSEVSRKVRPQKHYTNETDLRKRRDNITDQINKLQQKIKLSANDVDHKLLKLESKIVHARENLDVVKKISTQKETSIKYQINHDEMWLVYYNKRLRINNDKLTHAEPDEVPGLKTLIKFDKKNIRLDKQSLDKQWQLLQNVKVKRNHKVVSLENTINLNKNKLITVDLKFKQKDTKYKDQIKKLKNEVDPINKTLQSFEQLDESRKSSLMKEMNHFTSQVNIIS